MAAVINLDDIIKQYEPAIKKISYWYYGLWKSGSFDAEDLISAGREAVWQVSIKRPEKLDYAPYVKGAIKFATISRIIELTPKLPKQISLVRTFDEEVNIIDTLPSNSCQNEVLDEVDELEYYIRHEFSQEASESLLKLVNNVSTVFDFNLSKPPETETKDKVKLVTDMDLSDSDFLTYALVLTGAMDKFPRGFVVSQRDRARKYFKFLLEHLDISPEKFAISTNRARLLKKYGLDSFYQKIYHNCMKDLILDIFPDLESGQVKYRGKWQGREGLVNAYHAIRNFVKKTGKNPQDITFKDIADGELGGLYSCCFEGNGGARSAIEFAFPGTYLHIEDKVRKISEKMLNAGSFK